MLVDRRVFSHFDWVLLGVLVLIPLCSLTVLYSAGYDPEVTQVSFSFFSLPIQSQAFLKQLVFLGAGLLALTVSLAAPSHVLHRYAYFVYGICVVLLIITLFSGVVVNGSRRWIVLGPLNLQPSETMKIGLVLALSRYLSKFPPKRGAYTLMELIVPGLLVLVPMGLVARQPDLGSALSIGSIGLALILFMGIRIRAIVTIAIAAGLLVIPAWNSLHSYQQRRVLSLIDPESDPLGSGYHITQSKIAVGSGALLGKGFLRGTQTQLEFLPEHTTDFVFSVLAEEWGFVGCTFVLLLYVALLYRILLVVLRTKDLFSALLCFAVGGLLFFHAAINVGMVVGVLPVVGITLPLFSYGGSSLVSFLVLVGLVLGVSMRRFAFVAR